MKKLNVILKVRIADFEKTLKKNNPEAFPNNNLIKEEDLVLNDNYCYLEAGLIKTGNRCEVFSSGCRGEVKFVGKIRSHGFGFFVGIQLDEPVGDGNGSLEGVNYFSCPKKFAKFVRPNEIIIGDFPEEDFE